MGYIFSTRYYRNVNSGLVVCATTRSGLPLHKILNMRLLSTLAIAVAVCCHGTVQAQLELTALGVAVTEDFSGFAGAGFDASPDDGMLDSDTWIVTGLSDGDVDFGGSATTGDFARGSTMGGITTGGVYAADILDNQALMVQPGADDFTPGAFALQMINNTGATIGELEVFYAIYYLNDQGRSNSFNLSYSYDHETWVDLSDFDFISPEAATFLPDSVNRSGTITGLTWNDGEFFYLRWHGDDVAGSGSRDEFALDDVSVTGFEGEAIPVIGFSGTSATVSEDAGSLDISVNVSTDSDCELTVELDGSSTATEGVDFTFSSPVGITFSTGGALSELLNIPITNDTDIEGDETIVLTLTDPTGTCVLGVADMITITIADDDEPVATEADIADVTGEDADGIATSDGELVTITGLVYGYNLRSGGLEFTLIDETAGIKVFSFSETFGYTPNEGDELTMTGTITQFNGLTEIEPESLEVLSTGNTLKVPATVSALDESTESDLIHLTGCTLVDDAEWLGDGSSFNVNITCDGSGTLVMRIDDLVDLSTATVPDGAFNLTGIGSQFDTDAPYLDGYQIMPRYTADIDMIEDTAIAIVDLDPVMIELYPNPVSRLVHVHAPGIQMDMVTISDLQGQVMMQEMVSRTGQSAVTLELSALPSGMYLLHIISGDRLLTTTLVKE